MKRVSGGFQLSDYEDTIFVRRPGNLYDFCVANFNIQTAVRPARQNQTTPNLQHKSNVIAASLLYSK